MAERLPPLVDALGGLLVIDKDGGMTSHDVVGRCRKILRTRKIGHAGTLDPMATGVLVLGVERATKMLGLLMLTTKSYSATIRLGQSTVTDDAEGEVVSTTSAGHLTDAEIASVITTLTGDIQQVPATVSAIKVNGERAYARARAGEDVQLAARPVTVSRFEVLARRDVDAELGPQSDGVAAASRAGGPAGEAAVADDRESPSGPVRFVDLDVEVDCSSGTYIRALARDLGAALDVGGHLTALRRTRVGPFTLEHARTLDQFAADPTLNLDIDTAAALAFPHRTITDAEATVLRDGRWLDPVGITGVHAALTADGRAIALLEEKGKRSSPVMVVRPRGLID
ncbi:tRNA pseudouridine(55) synthase TruB [Nocardia stercoris]|uniref:tRNA pseudouridine synthase B n=1 Tax=Nocardia stercoris TaxID=2483361 RepID=A0A3M2KUL1_9NOCA|nr:tRNA pseudouridine(55) synthase TruB [Nocardia stercoris]RMI27913.1 tRNA pseudouridine(55) synthase TruB [Nocardia stercoris]